MNEQLRISRMEAVCNKIRSEMDDVLHSAYAAAVEAHDETSASDIARRIRNNLLDKSDKECVLDKMLPEAPDGVTFSAWLAWLRELAGVAKNDWAIYRQNLRDLTAQPGFPFDIEWPEAPNARDDI